MGVRPAQRLRTTCSEGPALGLMLNRCWARGQHFHCSLGPTNYVKGPAKTRGQLCVAVKQRRRQSRLLSLPPAAVVFKGLLNTVYMAGATNKMTVSGLAWEDALQRRSGRTESKAHTYCGRPSPVPTASFHVCVEIGISLARMRFSVGAGKGEKTDIFVYFFGGEHNYQRRENLSPPCSPVT